MARAATDDYLQNFRFHVIANLAQPQGETQDPLRFQNAPDGAEAGFATFTHPEYTINQVEYRDGLQVFPVHQPGLVSVNEVTMSRGVVRRDTVFLDWCFRYFDGLSYRADLTALQFTQDTQRDRRRVQPALGEGAQQARQVVVHEAFPVRVRPGGDLDASSDEVSMAEVDVKFEWFEILDDNLPVGFQSTTP
jgi:hypothetical protein